MFAIDSARNQVPRVEIAAMDLIDACSACDRGRVDVLLAVIKEKRRADFFWDEYSYGLSCEPVGYFGTVPSAFILLALVEAYRFTKEEPLLFFLLESADAFYGIENDGCVRKASLNKGDVLNTNLLAAMALKEVAEILPILSVRRRLFDEFARRALRKVLGYQSFFGHFPYHFSTFRSPILYQAMVCAELRFFRSYYADGALSTAWEKGVAALKKYFDKDGKILWEKANHQDKKGSIWAYSFAFAALDDEDPIALQIKMRLEQMKQGSDYSSSDDSVTPDPFFSAWVRFGLYWKKAPLCKRTKAPVKTAFLRMEYLFRLAQFSFRYIKHRVYSYPFSVGAMENRRWDK